MFISLKRWHSSFLNSGVTWNFRPREKIAPSKGGGAIFSCTPSLKNLPPGDLYTITVCEKIAPLQFFRGEIFPRDTGLTPCIHCACMSAACLLDCSHTYTVKTICNFTEKIRKVCKQIRQIWHVCDKFVTQKTTNQSVHDAGCSVEWVFCCKHLTEWV